MTDSAHALTDPGVRLHVVTGKGGTGKSTLAAALAVLHARRGRQVLLTEVEGRNSIASVFRTSPFEGETLLTRAGGGAVYGLSIDAKDALIEYLRTFYRLGVAGNALERLGAVDFATTIAPGVRDLLLTGKVYEAVCRPVGNRSHARTYDTVILDAPPTGRVVQFLTVSGAVGDLARVGPIHSQSVAMTELLRSAECAVHLTTLPEEMPVQETADTVAELREAALPVGVVLVNQAAAEVMSPAGLEDVGAGRVDPAAVGAELARLGLPSEPHVAAGLIDQARLHVDRLGREDAMLDRLDALGRPVLLLPELVEAAGPQALNRLADELDAQARL